MISNRETVVDLAMGARLIDRCGACGNTKLRSVLDLGTSPATCAMVPVGERRATEHHHPLELLYCDECTLAQLSVVVDPAEVFAPEYPYRSGNSPALHEDFEELAAQVGELGRWDLVVDIGANDGTLLAKFEDCRKVAVEPTLQGEHIDLPGAVYQQFFTEKLAAEIREDHGQAKVITACNVLAHVADIDDVMRGIATLLAPDGMLVVENHDLASVVDGGQWDTVYHEHLRFYSPYSFAMQLARHGFVATRWHPIPTHGGSVRMFAQRGEKGVPVPLRDYDFDKLARQAAVDRDGIRAAVRVGCYGIGATARATTIINYCGLDAEDIPCVCEVPGSDKIGHYIPGTRIPVVDESVLFEKQQPSILFSWHLADVIVPKLRERGYTGQIIVPLPELQYA